MTEQTLLNLISGSLWKNEQPTEIPSEVVSEAEHQAVAGLILKTSYQQIAYYIRYTYEEQELIQLLESHGIPLVILKGAAAAIYYPVPSRRSFGDIDFLVLPERFTDATELLEENGYTRGEDNERHIAYSKGCIHFELHRRYSHEDVDMERYVLDGLEHRVTGRIDQHEFPMLPPLANGLVLLVHVRQHLKSGLGLRQVIDWMMYCHRELNDGFWQNSFHLAAEETKLTTLAITVTALCQKYLGLTTDITWCRDADEALVDELLDSLLISGNFGRKQGLGNNVERIMITMSREGLFRYLQRAGEYNWKAYHRHHGLRPFCWLYQIFRYIRQGMGRIRYVRADLARGNDRYELLKKLGI